MACGMDALTWSFSCRGIHVRISKHPENGFLTVSSSSLVGSFGSLELVHTRQSRGREFVSSSFTVKNLRLPLSYESRFVRCMNYDGELAKGLSMDDAQALVAKNLIAAGIDEEDAVQVSRNCPLFIQKLMDAPSEPDEIDRWASLSIGAKDEDPTTGSSCEVKDLSGPERWSAVLEFVGVHSQTVTRVSHVLSNSPLPEFLKKVSFLEGTQQKLKIDGETLERKLHQMMRRLSVAADEDLQHTLSFFEKMDAQRGGLALLSDTRVATARLIEGLPQIFLRDLDTELRPVLTFLETAGVPNEALGRVVLFFPSILLCDVNRDLQPRLKGLKKIGVRARDLGKMISRYPWLLSRTAQNNVDEVVEFLFSIKVPGGEVDRSITRCPQLLGCSSVRTLQPMVECMNELDVKSTRLGHVIARSPQLLGRSPAEFNEVVDFLLKIGVEKNDMGGMLKRCPPVFASDVQSTLEPKVQFLRELGMKEEVIYRVLRFFPEMLLMRVEESMRPRVRYLQNWKLSKTKIAIMICRFPPLLGYNPEPVLKPKLEFLVNSMGRHVHEVVEYPQYFSYSLEDRIKPRARVIERRKIACSLKEMLGLNNDDFAAKFLGVGRILIPPS